MKDWQFFLQNSFCSFKTSCFSWHVIVVRYSYMTLTFTSLWLWVWEYQFRYFFDRVCCKFSWFILWKWPILARGTGFCHLMRTFFPVLQTCTWFQRVPSWFSWCDFCRQTKTQLHVSWSHVTLWNPCHWWWNGFGCKVHGLAGWISYCWVQLRCFEWRCDGLHFVQ